MIIHQETDAMTTQRILGHPKSQQPEEEAKRYTRQSILRSEQMYGEGFQSPGGLELLKAFCQKLHLWKGMSVLEIGSGLGGNAFYFAQEYEATVLGLDISQEMVDITTERKKIKKLLRVSFQRGDICTTPLPQKAFDLAWTRDCLLYIERKDLVWKNIYESLNQRGQLFVTDFCQGTGSLSQAFKSYVNQCAYYLQGIEDYAESIKAAGFQQVRGEDITNSFVDSLQQDQKRLNDNRHTFLQDYNQIDFDYLMKRWDKKIQLCDRGELKWGLFLAQK